MKVDDYYDEPYKANIAYVREKILAVLRSYAMSAKHLSELLDEPYSKVHGLCKELLRNELIEEVHFREQSIIYKVKDAQVVDARAMNFRYIPQSIIYYDDVARLTKYTEIVSNWNGALPQSGEASLVMMREFVKLAAIAKKCRQDKLYRESLDCLLQLENIRKTLKIVLTAQFRSVEVVMNMINNPDFWTPSKLKDHPLDSTFPEDINQRHRRYIENDPNARLIGEDGYKPET